MKIKLIAFFYLIDFLICSLSYSQNTSNIVKYWYYRNRLQYFVVSGGKYGESQLICVRNKLAWPQTINNIFDNADYGQHGKHTGFYLGTLATEYFLLNRNGQFADALKTYSELYYALNAIKIYWDDAAESYWPQINHNNPAYTNNCNGFFIRGNVSCDFMNINV